MSDCKILCKKQRSVKWAILLPLAVCYFIVLHYSPFVSDDIFYKILWVEHVEKSQYLPFLNYLVSKWCNINARMADNFNPIILCMMPKWLLTLINTVITIWLFDLIAKFSTSGVNVCLYMVSIVLSTFVLPWWEEMFLHVCWVNYVWSAMFTLLSLRIILNNERVLSINKLYFASLCFFIICAAMMHEACGVSLSCGLFLWCLYKRRFKNMNVRRRMMIFSFFIGAVLSISSPATYIRLITWNQSDINSMLWCNLFPIAVAIVSVFLLIRTAKQGKLHIFMESDSFIFFVALTISIVISVASMSNARSAWFGNIFAIILIVRFLKLLKFRVSRYIKIGVMTATYLVMILHYICFAYYQRKAGLEFTFAMELFEKSEDGKISVYYTMNDDIPWIISEKINGVEKWMTDMTPWVVSVYSRAYGKVPDVIRAEE